MLIMSCNEFVLLTVQFLKVIVIFRQELLVGDFTVLELQLLFLELLLLLLDEFRGFEILMLLSLDGFLKLGYRI